MFMEDTDEMSGMESSSSYQQAATPNYPPPPYQQTAFLSYQPTPGLAPVNSQPPPSYQGSMVNQQMTFQQQNNSAVAAAPPPTFQSSSQQWGAPQANAFPASATPATVPVNQSLNGTSLNSMGGANANSDNRLTMIKSFSNESGMNDEWAKK